MNLRIAPLFLCLVPLSACCLSGPVRPPVYDPIVTASGVHVQDRVVPEAGPAAKPGDTVTIDYVLSLEDGTVADSSLERGQPISFVLGSGEVPRGLEEGIEGMILRGERQIRVPSELGYGAAGVPPRIPPHALLTFNVELLELHE